MHTLSVPMTRASAGALPSVCSRHGEPAVLRMGFGRRQVRNWPFCRKCRTRWWSLLAVTLGALVTAFLALALPFVAVLFVADPLSDAFLQACFYAAMVLVAVAGFTALINTRPSLARAKITPDRQWVVLQGVHPRFTAELDRLVGARPHGRTAPQPADP